MNRHTRPQRQGGESLIEVVLALAIFLLISAAVGAIMFRAESSAQEGFAQTKALLLAREGLEAARSIRDGGFAALDPSAHGIALSGGHWTLTDTPDVVGQFTRSLDITLLSTGTAQVTSSVKWSIAPTRTDAVVLVEALTDWKR